jgi:ElaB/YqjD/DUF883 family membrane-anchored ribosome-binding protein
MDTEEITQEAGQSLRRAGTYVRENPVPTVLGALALGFAIGLIVRSMEKEDQSDRLRGRLEDAEDYLRTILKPLAKKSKRVYAQSADAVRDAVEDAVQRAHDIDVTDYTDPVAGWWNRFWKKCCR